MVKRVLFFCILTVGSLIILGVVFSCIGNPLNRDTWSHQFSNGSGLYINSHEYPLSFQTRQNKGARSIAFGRVEYIWGSHQ